MKRFTLDSGFEYFVKGIYPKIMIQTGTHGDEYGVMGSVNKAIKKYQSILPDFVYVPKVSPSAVNNKTRVNGNNLDLNRVFFSDSKDREVADNIALFKKFKPDLVVSFHEDLDRNDEFYMYESGYVSYSHQLRSFLEDITLAKIKLLNGVDDENDTDLCYEFENGYRFFPYKGDEEENGMICVWALGKKLVKNFQILEIPGKASQDIKDKIVDIYFAKILLNFPPNLN